MNRASLRIGEVATKAGVTTPALRFYERRGLLEPPARLASGYRAYYPETVVTVRFIKRAQDLGFSLREVAELLGLRDTERECKDVRRAAQVKLADVEDKIRQLRRMQKALRTLVASCSRKSRDQCPILEALEEGTER